MLKNRGKVHQAGLTDSLVVSIHPSAVLRAPDKEARQANYKMLVADLKLARRYLEQRNVNGKS